MKLEGIAINTKLTKLLGIKYPIIQGGMAWIADAGLAGAVSAAGGLGLIAGGNAPAEVIRTEIRKVKEMTDKPFGVNIMLLSPFASDLAQLMIEEKVPVVTTGAGNPSAFMDGWKSAGIKVLPVVPSVAYAKRLEKMGADALIAEGTEAGGHIGEITTMALIPQICDAVGLPVVAAGGIADGRGLAAVLMLGACGAQIGTRFLVSDECSVHDNYKQKVIDAKDTDSVVTGRATGHPVRGLKNKLVRQFKELEEKAATLEEYEQLGSARLKMAAKDGDVVYGSVMAGQIAGLVKQRQCASDILKEVVEEAQKLIDGGICVE
ncbi:MAG: enoyl-[acyl-carrier-protein] reductase FabK [Christensenellaceae bacterium]